MAVSSAAPCRPPLLPLERPLRPEPRTLAVPVALLVDPDTAPAPDAGLGVEVGSAAAAAAGLAAGSDQTQRGEGRECQGWMSRYRGQS